MKATLLLSAVLSLAAATGLRADGAASFESQIRPLLTERCVECHGDKQQKGELRLDAKAFAFKGGHDGPVIVPGDVAKSPLFQRITSTDDEERMPPKGEPLSAAQIAAVKAWIGSGAVWPENDADRAAAVDRRSQHWSVQPIARPLVPGVKFSVLSAQSSVKGGVATDNKLSTEHWALSTNPIDAFILAKLAEKNLTPSPEADRRTLIRRLSFDLHGLPPTPERVEQFVKDRDPRAYEKLVDELLSLPHYGPGKASSPSAACSSMRTSLFTSTEA